MEMELILDPVWLHRSLTSKHEHCSPATGQAACWRAAVLVRPTGRPEAPKNWETQIKFFLKNRKWSIRSLANLIILSSNVFIVKWRVWTSARWEVRQPRLWYKCYYYWLCGLGQVTLPSSAPCPPVLNFFIYKMGIKPLALSTSRHDCVDWIR